VSGTLHQQLLTEKAGQSTLDCFVAKGVDYHLLHAALVKRLCFGLWKDTAVDGRKGKRYSLVHMKLRLARGATWSFEANDQVVPPHLVSSWRKDRQRHLEIMRRLSANTPAEGESSEHNEGAYKQGDDGDDDEFENDDDGRANREEVSSTVEHSTVEQSGFDEAMDIMDEPQSESSAGAVHAGGAGAGGGESSDVIVPASSSAGVEPAVFGGVFRSTGCLRVRGSDDAQLNDGMCANCATITREEDFRGRMKRRRAGKREADHTRFSYLCRLELLDRCRQLRQRERALQFQVYFQTRRIAALKGRVLELVERVEEAAGRGDVRKVVDELVRAQATLAGKRVLLNFIYDLARNANAKSAKGKRWSTSTKNLYEVRCYDE
jgi:hypothetical protein